MAVTRINNNQITDASTGNVYLGIDASTKLQNYSITAQKIANNLTYGSNLTVTGNLTVQGNTTAIDTTITTIEDPVILLASMQTGTPAVDIGYIGQRGTSENIAFVWQESSKEFIAAYTSTAETGTTITVTGYANIHADNATIGGNATITGTTSLTGNILGDANITGSFTGGNLYSAGEITSTGTITGGNLATAGTASVSGNVTGGNILTAGLMSATGNVYAANFIGNVSGNVAVPGANTQVVFNDNGTANAVSGFEFNKTSNTVTVGNVVSAAGNVVAGNVTTAGRVSATGDISGANVSVTGNVIPTANIAYTLGNNTNRWSSLYVSGQTIHLGNLQLKETDANVFGVYLDDGVTLTQVNASIVSGTGNITGGNLATGGLVTATGTVTGGNLATGGTASVTGTITGGNVATAGTVSATGTVTGGNVATAGTVSATGTVTGGNVATAGTVSATGTVTGGNLATGGTASATGSITGGNIITGGAVSATGNITADPTSFFIGNGRQLTGVVADSANAETLTGTFLANNVVGSSLTSVGVLGSLSVAGTATVGNVATAGTVSATGTVTGGNVATAGTVSATGTVTGGNLATGGTVSATGTVTGGNVATAGTASVGGNITGGNILTGGLVSATGAIDSGATITGGNLATGGTVSATGDISGANVRATGTVSASGDITGANVSTGGYVTATGDVTGGNVATAGTVSATGNITGANVNTAQVYSSSALTITNGTGNINLSPQGNVVLGNSYINGLALTPQQDGDAASKYYVDILASTGLSFHQAVVAATTTTLATATGGTITYTQPNGVSNGIGAYLSTTGSFNLIDTANVQTAGTRILVKNEGNAVYNGVYGWTNATTITRTLDADQYGANSVEELSINDYFFVTSGNVNAGSSFVVSAPPGVITFGSSNIEFSQFSQSQVYNAGNGVAISGTLISAKVDDNTTAFDNAGNIIVKAGANLTTPNIGAATGTSLSVTSTVTGGNVATGGTISGTGTITGGNVATAGTVSATGTVTGGNVATAGTVSATGTVTGGNVETAGTVSATGSITSATTITGGNVATAGYVSATGDVTGGNVATAGTVSSTGTVTGGNIATAGTISGTGTVTGGNVETGGTVSATGSITGGNVYTAGKVSATGNITGNYFIGNGSQLTGVTASSVDANNLTGTTLASSVVNSSLTSVGNLTVLSVVGTATVGNVATAGTVSATGTVTGGNVATAGTVSATGTVTGGNVATAGTVSATGSITGGNIYTGGESSTTGTVTGGNVATGGYVSATGTVTGGNLATAGTVSATGTVTGGNVATAGTVSATGTVTGGNVVTGGIVSAIGTVTGGNVATAGTVSATGNIGTSGSVSATGDVTGGNVLTGGIVSATGNIYAANFVGNVSGNLTIPGANTDVVFNDNGVANATPGFTFDKVSNTVTVGANVDAVSFNGNVYSTTVSATGTITGGNLVTSGAGGSISGSGNITGGNINTAGALQGGNIVISGDDITDTNGRVNFNTALSTVDFAVNGTAANVLYVNATTNTASFGSSTQTTNSIVSFNATNSILMPVGNTAQRPAGVVGQFRFNTSINSLEVYSATGWKTVGVPDFTLITDQQFNGDGSTTVFTLTANATTAGSIVSINGVQQIPVTAYAVNGTTLTFTEAPEVGDLIDVRVLITTTTVYGITNSNDTASVYVVDGSPIVEVTGDLSVSGSILGGNINSTAIVFGSSNMSVVSSGGNIRANVAGTTVQTISPGLVAITGDLSVSGNATLSGNILGDRLQNGTTSIDIQTAGGNANITVGGTSNVAVFAPAGLYITGNISATGDVIAQNVNSLSDATLKTNVTPIDDAEQVVNALNGVGYDWKDGSGHAYGLIAQDVEQVVPEAVKTDENGIKSVNYQMLIPFLIETVKKQGEEIAKLKNK